MDSLFIPNLLNILLPRQVHRLPIILCSPQNIGQYYACNHLHMVICTCPCPWLFTHGYMHVKRL